MICNCAEFEILLCDAVDGTLRGEQQAAFEAHRQSCAACNEVAADVIGVTAFIGRVADVHPPKELLTKILFETAGSKAGKTIGNGGWLEPIKQFLRPVLKPRLGMGMLMTILSVSMLAQAFGLEVRQLKAADLDPVRIWSGVEDTTHRHWSRLVQYYENIRVVYEIQSRLKEWADQQEQDRQSQAKEPASTPPNTTVTTPPPSR